MVRFLIATIILILTFGQVLPGQRSGRMVDSLLAVLDTTTAALNRQLEIAELTVLHARDLADPVRLHKAYSELGILQMNTGNFQECLATHLKELEVSKTIDSTFLEAISCYHLGNLHLELNESEEAEKWLNEAFVLFQQAENKRWEGIVLNALGIVNFQREELEKGLAAMHASMEIFEAEDLEKDLRIPLNNIGYYLLEINDPRGAVPYLERSYELELKHGNPKGQSITLANLGFAYQYQGDYEKAQSLFEEALTITEIHQFTNLERDFHKDLAEHFELVGDFNQSLIHYKAFHTLGDSLMNAENARQIAELRVQYQTDEAEEQVENMSEIITALRTSSLVNRVINILFVVLALILGLIIYLWYSRNRVRNQLMTLNLHQQEAESERLRSQLEEQKQDLTNFALDISRKNEFSNEVLGSLKSIIDSNPEDARAKARELLSLTSNHLQINEDIHQFQRNVEQVNQQFFSHLMEKFPTLTAGERHLCGLIRLNLSSKEIAVIRGVSTKTVEMARYRLRKKLQLNPSEELNAFIQSF